MVPASESFPTDEWMWHLFPWHCQATADPWIRRCAFCIIPIVHSSKSCDSVVFIVPPPPPPPLSLLGSPPHGVTYQAQPGCLIYVHGHLTLLHCHSVWQVPWLPVCGVSWLVYRDCQPWVDCPFSAPNLHTLCSYWIFSKVAFEKTSLHLTIPEERRQIHFNNYVVLADNLWKKSFHLADLSGNEEMCKYIFRKLTHLPVFPWLLSDTGTMSEGNQTHTNCTLLWTRQTSMSIHETLCPLIWAENTVH